MNPKPIFSVLMLTASLLCPVAHGEESWKLKPEVQQRCLEILRDGMRGDDFWPAMHAAEALSVAGQKAEVREFLTARLPSESDDQRRCGLARELVRAGDAKRSAVMLEVLQSADPHGHVHAAESLYKVGWEGDEAPLEKAFTQDGDIRLRLMAAAALARHTQGPVEASAFVFLRQTLRDERDPDVFRLAAWVLARIGTDADCGLIRSRLGDVGNDNLVRAFLEHALAALGDPGGRERLLGNLSSNDPAIRTYAAVFAGECGILEAAPFLIRQLDDDNPDARIRAAQALLLLAK